LIGPCRVFEHLPDRHIGRADLEAAGFVPTRRALFKTRNSAGLKHGRQGQDFLSLLPDAIEHLLASGVELLGIDALSIGPFGEITDRNHVRFCGAGGVIIETLNLSDVEPGEYGLIALPLKFEGIEASPARVVLIQPGDLDSVFQVPDAAKRA
jgi:arylformamidase